MSEIQKYYNYGSEIRDIDTRLRSVEQDAAVLKSSIDKLDVKISKVEDNISKIHEVVQANKINSSEAIGQLKTFKWFIPIVFTIISVGVAIVSKFA